MAYILCSKGESINLFIHLTKKRKFQELHELHERNSAIRKDKKNDTFKMSTQKCLCNTQHNSHYSLRLTIAINNIPAMAKVYLISQSVDKKLYKYFKFLIAQQKINDGMQGKLFILNLFCIVCSYVLQSFKMLLDSTNNPLLFCMITVARYFHGFRLILLSGKYDCSCANAQQ